MGKRYCVDKCPTFVSGTLSVPTCLPSCSGVTWVSVNADGTMSSGTAAGTPALLYDSTDVLDRICIPGGNVFE